MRTSLVFPPFYLESLYNLPPLGLINLATVLRDAGHEPTIKDFVLDIRRGRLAMGNSMYRDCARAILDDEPEMIAFSAQCATYPPLLQIARELKRERPHVPIVVGGHNASFVDEQTLAHSPDIDIIARGEGERTVVELADALQGGYDPLALGEVAGLTFRGDAGQAVRTQERELICDLDSLPLPDYSFAPSITEYRDACDMNRSIAILEVGRGCPHACVYCSESSFWRRSVRTFSVDRMVGEMRKLRDEHEADCFVLSYDQFTADKDFVRDFCAAVIDQGINKDVSWYCISRLDTMDDELLGLMREAGLESLCYGIDSGSAKTLSFINKQIDPNLLSVRVAETTSHGVVPTLSFIIGFPHEEREDIDSTLELALRCVVLGNVSPLLQMPTVLAGTELHNQYADDLTREVDTYFALGLEFDEGKRLACDDALIDSNPQLFSSFYNLKCKGVSLQELGRLADNFPLILNLYPKSFLLLAKTTNTSLSLLFDAFLDFVAAAQGGEKGTLSAPEVFNRFPIFLAETMQRASLGSGKAVYAMLEYESAGLQAARPIPTDERAEARAEAKGPRRVPGIEIREPACDIQAIIEDIRNSRLRDDYPDAESVLVFRHENGRLEVLSMNAFGKRFLELSDGSRSIEEIAAVLRPEFGAGMSEDDFTQNLRDAVETFRSLRLVETDAIATSTHGEVSC
jgi:radical SAM superfamily enzyme YgiQ (UPF0313 family)